MTKKHRSNTINMVEVLIFQGSHAIIELRSLSYDNDIPTDKNGNPVTYDNKSRNMDKSQYKEQAESRKKNNI